ncbi:peptidoglycan DD-metalloendopeptidase family protein [Microbacterium sp. STN6]|uniref:M23 family metallopeptidase n=1 Tax=Microbacterium sp. STN6 TaxID=2995588 RepID=UPI002260E57C|nr:peptidoglycan DD-metalloendopeptidase family protein [Microbacterium sp. STN6]MCX7522130.1 peptidoglycan DD-metalloendopeptidase family protein [Microbacterium sp. STN6]
MAWAIAVVSVAFVLAGVPSAAADASATAVAADARETAADAQTLTPPSPASHGASARWAWPLAPPWRVLRGFEAPETRYSAGHRGIDLMAAPGDAVLAPEAGTIYFTGQVAGRPVVTLELDDAVLVSFEPVTSALAKDSTVTRGDRIGTLATGGHCNLHCMHVGVRVNGRYVSPLLYLGGVPRAVLLPLHN